MISTQSSNDVPVPFSSSFSESMRLAMVAIQSVPKQQYVQQCQWRTVSTRNKTMIGIFAGKVIRQQTAKIKLLTKLQFVGFGPRAKVEFVSSSSEYNVNVYPV